MNPLIKNLSDLPDATEMEMLMKYCEIIAQAPTYASMGGMPGVFALVMTARELGIGPMTALNGGMYLIPNLDKEGKAKGPPQIMMSARTMNMMILKNGHKIEEIENVPGKVTLKGTRVDNGVSMTVSMTAEMAKTAGLSHDMYGKPKMWSVWFKNMDDMLWKTCLSKIARRLFADVIGNAYEPAEFAEAEEKAPQKPAPELKKLTGKNILPEPDDGVTFEQFLQEHKLADNCAVQDLEMTEYIKSCAEKKGRSYEEMLKYCYENRVAFINAYQAYLVEKGVEEVVEE